MFGANPYRIINSFNAGEMGPTLNAREDLAKFQSGCSIMENMIPLPQGGAQKRPGTKYIAEVKTSSLATRLLPFEFSTSQSYAIESGNQYFRFYANGAQVMGGEGTETLTGGDKPGTGHLVAHWLLNETEGASVVNDDNPGTYNGTASVDTSTLTMTGKVGTGAFDLDNQYNVTVADASVFSFDDSGSNPYSLACWGDVEDKGSTQVLLSKWDETTGSVKNEWRLSLDNNRKLQLHMADTSADLSSNRVAQWKMNDDAASKAVDDDVAVVPHDGTASANTVTLTATGKLDKCFNFAGTASVAVDDDAALSFGNGTVDSPFSIASWIYVTSNANAQMILSKTDTNGKEWQFFVLGDTQNQKLAFDLTDDSESANIRQTSDVGLAVGKWHFVVGTYDATESASGINLYVDGDLVASTAGGSGTYIAMESLSEDVVIGARNPTTGLELHFQDKIDNTVLFDIELTPANIGSLYRDGSGTETMGTAEISAISDDAVSLGWHFFTATYDSTGGSSAADGIILYVDGIAVSSAATNDTTYTSMQNGDALVRIGAQESTGGAAEKFWNSGIDEVSIFSDVLTPSEVVSLYTSVPYEIETPYLTADLFNLIFEQSADVLYITHESYETRKLTRLSNGLWSLVALDTKGGPFRTQNSDVADLITSSATTGTVTLTATGHTPFGTGSTIGHEPSGSTSTNKSNTGALFKLVHPLDTLEYKDTLEDDYDASQTSGVSWHSCGTLYDGAEWTWVTGGTWLGTVGIQRNYTIGADHDASGWETVFQHSGITTARNVSTTGSEDGGDADYRVVFIDDTSGAVISYFSTDQTEVVGIVEITSVTSATSAIGTVIRTLGSTDATHKWSEGAWSNYRGWPRTVSFFEDRLMFGGNTSQPDTIWGSVTSDYDNMTAGANDDEAVIFTLSSRQVNVVEWLVGKDKLLIGTSGAEWTIAGGTDEPLSPTNVIAKQHSTYGSASLQAGIANESVLFFQRGAEKMRELAYNWELDSYVAPDMTILSNQIADGGITSSAFQKSPDSILWTTRTDGEMPIFSYERAENVTAWSRMVTEDGTSDSDFESVARISGSPEDEVWVIVERTINGLPVRYIEQFQPRDFDTASDAFFVDCGVSYTGGTTTATGLGHLVGETVVVLGDGVAQTEAATGDFIVTAGGEITLPSTFTTAHIGLPYEVHLRTMPLSWVGGTTVHGKQKRISEVVAEWYLSGDFGIGRDASTLQTYTISGQTTSIDRKTFPPGWDRNGYVYIYQKSPEPLTLMSVMTEFNLQ